MRNISKLISGLFLATAALSYVPFAAAATSNVNYDAHAELSGTHPGKLPVAMASTRNTDYDAHAELSGTHPSALPVAATRSSNTNYDAHAELSGTHPSAMPVVMTYANTNTAARIEVDGHQLAQRLFVGVTVTSASFSNAADSATNLDGHDRAVALLTQATRAPNQSLEAKNLPMQMAFTDAQASARLLIVGM